MKRVLVVDDSNLMRNSVSQCLANAGYEVVGKERTAGRPIELYRRLKRHGHSGHHHRAAKDGIAAAERFSSWTRRRTSFLT